MKRAGFTLLEMMIAVTIMGTLSVFTAQSINRAIKSRAKIQTEIDQTSVMRDVLRVMERDINLAFNYRNIHYEVLKKIKEESNPGTAPINPTNPVQPPPLNPSTPATPTQPLLTDLKQPPPIWTHFLGETESAYFTTLSHTRMVRNSQESDQAEVGYFVKNCRPRGNPRAADSSCLWRKESPYIDDDLLKGGTETPILENVEKFELRYFGEEMEGWQKQWRTDEKGPTEIRNRFPQAVQVRLTIKDRDQNSKKKYSMVLVAALRFPNNPPLDQSKKKDQPNDKSALPQDN